MIFSPVTSESFQEKQKSLRKNWSTETWGLEEEGGKGKGETIAEH